ncbi:MAG TPA: hypothetical protein VJ084_02360, partial [Nitrospinota bacterium]|nr:hypothetical protein [Nitrospinota bacterium]
MGKSNTLDEIISQLKRSLEFASKNSFANLSHLRDLESAINSLIDRAVSFLSHQSSAVSHQNNLIKIKDLFSGFDSLSLPEKKERLKTAQNLLESLRVKELKSLGVNSIIPQLHNSSTSIQFVKGVGEKRAKLLSKLNIQTIEDALYFMPMRYEDRSRMKKISEILNPPPPPFNKGGQNGIIETIAGTILSRGVIKTKWGKRLFEVVIKDETGLMRGKWFKFNEKY